MFDDTKLDVPLTRRHLDEVSRDHPIVVGSSRRTHELVQHQGVRAGGHHQGHARSRSRPLLPRRERRAHRPRRRARARRASTRSARARRSRPSSSASAAGSGMRAHLGAADRGGPDVRARRRRRSRSHPRLRGRARQRASCVTAPASWSAATTPSAASRPPASPTASATSGCACVGVKFGADGSASERTMRMSTPYVGTNDYGILTMTQKEIDEAVEDAHRHNLRVAIHANGDVTIDMVLKAYERVLKQWPRPDPRHRIEHCSLVNPELLAPHQGARRDPDAVLDLRALSRREVEVLRPGQDALDVRAQVVPRHRHSRRRRVRLRPGSVRAADGHPKHGHAQGLRW